MAGTNYTNEDENYGKTWMYFPDGDGVPQKVYLTEPPENSRARGRSKSVKERVQFELYTRFATSNVHFYHMFSHIFTLTSFNLVEKLVANQR